jgi:hypothetical protein
MKYPVRSNRTRAPRRPSFAECTRDKYVLPSLGLDIFVALFNRLRPPRTGFCCVKSPFETHKIVGNRRLSYKIAFKFTSRTRRDIFVRLCAGRNNIVFAAEDVEGT